MKQLLESVCGVALRAGDIIMEVYSRDFSQLEKDDKSPLTEADLAAHHSIINDLDNISALPVLSEEGTIPPWAERIKWQEYWIIDPLDGTKEFIKRNGEFTVNIALVADGKPILGVVYAPALDTLYFAAEGVGAFKLNSASTNALQRADFISTVSADNVSIWHVVGSRSHGSQRMEAFVKALPDHKMLPMGSSLKLCMVAEGKADLYPRLAPTSEWDTAAAHAVVVQAGGMVLKGDLTELEYNSKDDILNPHFIVCSQIHSTWSSFFK